MEWVLSVIAFSIVCLSLSRLLPCNIYCPPCKHIHATALCMLKNGKGESAIFFNLKFDAIRRILILILSLS